MLILKQMQNLKELNRFDVEIYADGSCRGNPGNGGYAFSFYIKDEQEWFLFGRGNKENTTNNQMELLSVIKSLEELEAKKMKFKTITVCSDSAYVVNGFLENWIDKWEENNWKTNKGLSVLNQEYWKRLKRLVESNKVNFKKISRKCKKINVVSKEAKYIANILKKSKNH